MFVKLLGLAERPEVNGTKEQQPRLVACLDNNIAEDTTNP